MIAAVDSGALVVHLLSKSAIVIVFFIVSSARRFEASHDQRFSSGTLDTVEIVLPAESTERLPEDP